MCAFRALFARDSGFRRNDRKKDSANAPFPPPQQPRLAACLDIARR
ncbi:MAG: hypothetical protein OXU61_06960 [Gammaproteobacteria bacterium]|nr:hypothetical protein [Gammaproteobacteria bacterium]